MESYMGKVVQLIYIDRKKNVSIRDVRIISVKGKQFKAYCYSAGAMRIFNEDNVVDVEISRHVWKA
ncbi:hypothetical protein D3P07_08105 [Paenibacillus sp. 1011MAR3C5]|uniref:hypothetical protein n=1 Tax=Paenibacillus sp. 1011MAR3C5 TaxID=1675787 RepID=UPI000E6C3103|nr:hypothetical protein [Paenibacillus sp. 1011MAR3C5]RJE90167.1 hypothetical protein D3P07_08105 [Paenibacillus sp. 1011MAR3C5]